MKVNPNLLNIQHVVELSSGDKYISTAAYILIGFGVFVLLVGLFGFIGGLKQIKCFLAMVSKAQVNEGDVPRENS